MLKLFNDYTHPVEQNDDRVSYSHCACMFLAVT
jgi:hypothetical protein